MFLRAAKLLIVDHEVSPGSSVVVVVMVMMVVVVVLLARPSSSSSSGCSLFGHGLFGVGGKR